MNQVSAKNSSWLLMVDKKQSYKTSKNPPPGDSTDFPLNPLGNLPYHQNIKQYPVKNIVWIKYLFFNLVYVLRLLYL